MTQRRFVTLIDVARRAGVTKGTVSAVINGANSNTRVSDETRRRIEKAAAELNYRPHAIARSLTHRRTNILGFYSGYPTITPRSLFLAEILTGFQAGCARQQKDMLLHGVFPGRSAAEIYAELANGKVDGLVLYSPPDDPLIELLADSDLPVVALADPIPSLPSVVADDVSGARLLAEHLAARGHTHVLYHIGTHQAVSVERRRSAFRAEAEARSIRITEGCDTSNAADPHGLSREERELLLTAIPDRPTAAVCWTDRAAYSLLQHCRRVQLRVPQDIAIAGFNGLEPEFPPLMTLTTIRAPWAQVAETAVDLVVARIEGKEVAQETVLPVELVPGETT